MVLRFLRKISVTAIQTKPLSLFFHTTVAHSYRFSFTSKYAEDYIQQNQIFTYFTINSQGLAVILKRASNFIISLSNLWQKIFYCRRTTGSFVNKAISLKKSFHKNINQFISAPHFKYRGGLAVEIKGLGDRGPGFDSRPIFQNKGCTTYSTRSTIFLRP